MAFILILVILLPYIALIHCVNHKRLRTWWLAHKLLGSLAIALAIIAVRMFLYFGIPKLMGTQTLGTDVGDFGLPFLILGLLEYSALNEIGMRIVGFHPRFEILDDPVILAMTNLILLFPIFLVCSFIVGSIWGRNAPQEIPKN